MVAWKRKGGWLVAWDPWKRGEVQKDSDEKQLWRLNGQETPGLRRRRNLYIRRVSKERKLEGSLL